MRTAAAGRLAGAPALLDPGWNGGEEAFRRLVEGQRAALHSHCYRMLGSLHDAEDAFQETMLRAWRGLPGYQGRSSPKTWLHRIATNVCIDALKRRPKHVSPTEPGLPAPREPVRIEPCPDREPGIEEEATAPEARYERREEVERALIAALEQLPARQRAVLIVREVLGFSAQEAAVILETTVASINSALQRARKTLGKRPPERTQQATLRSVRDSRVRDLVERFVNAFERGDIGAILALLAEDSTFAMPPLREAASRPRRDRRPLAHARRAPAPPSLRPNSRHRTAGAGHLPPGPGERLPRVPRARRAHPARA